MLFTILIIQLDKIYPKKLNYFGIYYAWAISFWTFLYVIKWLMGLIIQCDNPASLIVPAQITGGFFENKMIAMTEINWVNSSWLQIDWHFNIGVYELIMLSIVTFVSSMVQLYSINYMIFDDYKKFITYITLFTLFMVLLVSSGNFLILFLGWEGVGVCSYLLINF